MNSINPDPLESSQKCFSRLHQLETTSTTTTTTTTSKSDFKIAEHTGILTGTTSGHGRVTNSKGQNKVTFISSEEASGLDSRFRSIPVRLKPRQQFQQLIKMLHLPAAHTPKKEKKEKKLT